MTFTHGGFVGEGLIKKIGWPVALLIGAGLAIGIGVAIGAGTSALAISSDPAKQQAAAAPAPTPKTAGLAAAYLAGRHAETTAQVNTAVNFYNRVTELDPENVGLLQSTYFLAAQNGDFGTAIPAARKAFDAAPTRGMAAVILGIELYKKGEYDKALEYLSKTTAQSMNGFALPLMRAWALAPTQPADKALRELELLKAFPDTSDVYYVMSAMVNEFYGNTDQAVGNYEVLAANIEKQRFSVLRIVAEGLHRLGRNDELKGLFTRFLSTHTDAPTIDAYASALPTMPVKKLTAVEGMSEAMFDAAEMLLANEPNELRAQVATAYAQTALYLNPDLDIARRFIGSTLAARGRYTESNAMLASIKPTTLGYIDVQMQKAENLLRLDRSDEALSTLQAIAKEKPQWIDVYVAMGDIYRGQKKFGEAVTAYDNALKFSPQGKDENWAIHYSRGIALDRAKKWDAAEKDFRRALELRPDDPSVLNYLGYSYLDRGEKLPEARKLIEDAYKQRPNDGYIIDSFGWALYKNGQFPEAVQNLEKAVESTPADGTINEHLGDAYWKVGRRNEARFQWQRALLSTELEESQRAAILTKLERGLAAKQ